MKVGSLKFFFILISYLLFSSKILSEEKLKLENIQPTFEEETENKNEANYSSELRLKSKAIKKNKSGNIIVRLKALDKITAKTSNIDIPLGKKKKFGYLEIHPPCLSANLPKIGVTIPHINACNAIARPNSVLVIPQSISKSPENNPKVCLTPIVTFTTKQAATKVINAVLFGKNFDVI